MRRSRSGREKCLQMFTYVKIVYAGSITHCSGC